MLHRIKADTRVIIPDLVRHAKSMWSMARIFRFSILGCCLQMSELGLRRWLSGYAHLLYRFEGMCLHKNVGLVVLDICMDRDRGDCLLRLAGDQPSSRFSERHCLGE